MQEKENEIYDQEKIADVAAQVKQRSLNEIPHLVHVIEVCDNNHDTPIAPLCGVMHSFALFCNSEDNIAFLKDIRELYVSYSYNKRVKNMIERSSSKKTIKILNEKITLIENYKRKGQEVDFMFDFYPLVRRYNLLLINGHRPGKDEIDICKSMLSRVRAIAQRELDARNQAIESCNKFLK